MNGGLFDGGQLTKSEQSLRDFYQRLMTISAQNSAMLGSYRSLHQHNRQLLSGYNHQQFSFVRWQGQERLIVVSNFDAKNNYQYTLHLPADLVKQWQLSQGEHPLVDLLFDGKNTLTVNVDNSAEINIDIAPLSSFVFQLQAGNQ